MKFRKAIIASVIVGGLALVLGFIFIGILVQAVVNSQLMNASTQASNWSGYAAAYGVVQLVPLFVAILMIVVAATVAIGFLKATGMM